MLAKKIPDVYVIVFFLILFSAALTWILPGGAFQRETSALGDGQREVIVPGSFVYAPSMPQFFSVFSAPMRGFVKLSEIIVFILMVGGAFAVLNETGAVAAGTRRLTKALVGREFWVIPVVMVFFSFFGAAFGMCEEAIVFALFFVPLALALGYDSIVGVCLSFVAAGVGFAGAFLNPFTLQIAQGIVGLQPVSGWGYRLVVWSVSTSFAVIWVMIYAARIKKDPSKSCMYELDKERRATLESQMAAQATLSRRHMGCLIGLALTIVTMIYGVIALDWFIIELGGLFFAMGIYCGIISGMGANQLAENFIEGVKDMAKAALIVGFAGGILVILEDGKIMDTILFGVSSVLAKMPPILAADVMYFFQMFLNFFIPSGATKAALTMPLMGPIADLSGITRQTAVLAYQLGDGFSNMIFPTSGVTIGTLAMARIPFEKWFRWHLPMQLAFVALSLLLLVWPVLSHWTG